MVQNIYADRTCLVAESGTRSSRHQQHFGISQGCPLSPFLFVIVMTVLLHDSKALLHNADGLSELVYADDTLLLGVDAESLHAFMTHIGTTGREYGLEFNWSKLELLPVRTTALIR